MPDHPTPAAKPPVIMKPAAPPLPQGRDKYARGLGVAGLLLALGALGYAVAQPMLNPPPAPPRAPDMSAIKRQIADLAAAIDDVKKNPPQPAVTQMPAPAMAEDPVLAGQLNGALTEIAALRDRLANLQQSIAGAEEIRQQLLQFRNDLAVANTAISGMRGHVQQMSDATRQAALSESATRAHMLAYMQLRAAAAAAAPFVNELAALCAVTQDSAAIAAECVKLENAAHAGAATLPMLQARFTVMAGPAERAVAMADAKSWTDRLKVSFDEVVRIRRIDAAGNPAETPRLVHDAAAALQRGNIAGAVEKVEAMPAVARQELQEWLSDARARLELDAALARIGVALGQVPLAPVTPAAAGETADQ